MSKIIAQQQDARSFSSLTGSFSDLSSNSEHDPILESLGLVSFDHLGCLMRSAAVAASRGPSRGLVSCWDEREFRELSNLSKGLQRIRAEFAMREGGGNVCIEHVFWQHVTTPHLLLFVCRALTEKIIAIATNVEGRASLCPVVKCVGLLDTAMSPSIDNATVL